MTVMVSGSGGGGRIPPPPPKALPRSVGKAIQAGARQGRALPPIVTRSPPRASGVGSAIAAGARVAASSRPVQSLAARIAKQARRGPPTRLSAAIANQSRLATQSPFAPIAGGDLLQSRPLRELMFQGQFNQDFQTLKRQGLIPKDAKEPSLTFPVRAAGPEGELSFETGTADAGNARVHISPSVLFQATQSGGFVPNRAWAQETPIHELAHALQKPQVLRNKALREGGAQAFADAAAIKALGPISENDTNYTGYVRNVRAKKGPAFFMRGQFG